MASLSANVEVSKKALDCKGTKARSFAIQRLFLTSTPHPVAAMFQGLL